jgi:hypothetical protein
MFSCGFLLIFHAVFNEEPETASFAFTQRVAFYFRKLNAEFLGRREGEVGKGEGLRSVRRRTLYAWMSDESCHTSLQMHVFYSVFGEFWVPKR